MKSRLHKFQDGYTWTGVEKEPYRKPSEKAAGCYCGVHRQTFIGLKGEATKFHFRYFEIPPGGSSSLEKHMHEHAVVCARGKGRVLAEDMIYDMEHMDVLYIAPDVPHQLINPYGEPFGFFCIVDAERDRPRELSCEELKRLEASEATKGKFIGYIEGD